MNPSYELSCRIQNYIIVFLIVLVISFFLFSIFIFLPPPVKKNFDRWLSKAALKLRRILWRVLKFCLFLIFALVLFALSPLLWPVYLGIAALRPEAVVKFLYNTKVF